MVPLVRVALVLARVGKERGASERRALRPPGRGSGGAVPRRSVSLAGQSRRLVEFRCLSLATTGPHRRELLYPRWANLPTGKSRRRARPTHLLDGRQPATADGRQEHRQARKPQGAELTAGYGRPASLRDAHRHVESIGPSLRRQRSQATLRLRRLEQPRNRGFCLSRPLTRTSNLSAVARRGALAYLSTVGPDARRCRVAASRWVRGPTRELTFVVGVGGCG